MTDTYTYDAFGATKTHTGTSPNVWEFTGEQNDTTVNQSPYYLRARYYDPLLGRFLTRDPFRGFTLSPQSQNRYVYNANDPVNLVDPYGLCGIRSWGDLGDCGKKVGEGAAALAGSVRGGLEPLRDPAIIYLDYLSFSYELMSAGVTDTAAVIGCFAGPEGCAGGYWAGYAFTEPLRAYSALTAIGAAALTMTKGCNTESAISWGTASAGAYPRLEEPNLGLGIATYQLCRDIGLCKWP